MRLALRPRLVAELLLADVLLAAEEPEALRCRTLCSCLFPCFATGSPTAAPAAVANTASGAAAARSFAFVPPSFAHAFALAGCWMATAAPALATPFASVGCLFPAAFAGGAFVFAVSLGSSSRASSDDPMP